MIRVVTQWNNLPRSSVLFKTTGEDSDPALKTALDHVAADNPSLLSKIGDAEQV